MNTRCKKGEDLKDLWDTFVSTSSESAFHGLYKSYYHYLSYLGLKKGYSSAKVKDCFNDLFLYLWENTDNLNGVRNHHNYIITAFLRKLYNKDKLAADESIDLSTIADHSELHIAPSAEAKHIMDAMHHDASRILSEHVERLPQKQRQMIYQKFYLGLSYGEISVANQVSINTVYKSVYNALSKLRIQLGKEQLTELSIAFGAISILFLLFC